MKYCNATESHIWRLATFGTEDIDRVIEGRKSLNALYGTRQWKRAVDSVCRQMHEEANKATGRENGMLILLSSYVILLLHGADTELTPPILRDTYEIYRQNTEKNGWKAACQLCMEDVTAMAECMTPNLQDDMTDSQYRQTLIDNQLHKILRDITDEMVESAAKLYLCECAASHPSSCLPENIVRSSEIDIEDFYHIMGLALQQTFHYLATYDKKDYQKRIERLDGKIVSLTEAHEKTLGELDAAKKSELNLKMTVNNLNIKLASLEKNCTENREASHIQELSEKDRQIEELKKQVETLSIQKKQLEGEVDYLKLAAEEEQESAAAKELTLDHTKRYLFVGGHPSTFRKLKELFPNSDHMLNTSQLSGSNLFSYQEVVFITTYVGHSIYECVKNACIKGGIPYMNSNCRNANLIAKDIAEYESKEG